MPPTPQLPPPGSLMRRPIGFCAVEIRARVRLVDDGDTRRAAPIGRLEQRPVSGTNAERREKLRRNLVAVGELIGDGRIAADHGVGGESHGEQALVQRRSGRRARGTTPGSASMRRTSSW